MLALALVSYLLVLPLLVLVGPVVVLLDRPARRALPLALWALACVLLLVWVVRSYQSGVAADELGTEGDVFDTAGWLGAAAVLAGASVAAGRRSRDAGKHGRT